MPGWEMFFDGWSPVVRTLVLGTGSYVALVILLRASGKRTLSKMNAFDFVVTIAIGSVLASILIAKDVSFVQGALALALLISLQLINTSLSVRSPAFQGLIKAQPTLIFFRGEFLRTAMKQQRVTEAEILAAMRQQGVGEPSSVDAVIIETEGSLSVLQNGAGTGDLLTELGVPTG